MEAKSIQSIHLLLRILYNMRYNSLDIENGTSTNNTTQEILKSEWIMLQQQPGKDNLRLFDMDNCGLPSDQTQTLGQISTPWVGFFSAVENVTDKYSSPASLVVLISEWYALAPKDSTQKNATW